MADSDILILIPDMDASIYTEMRFSREGDSVHGHECTLQNYVNYYFITLTCVALPMHTSI